MTDSRPVLLISDACVLIDYVNADSCEAFRLISDNLFPILVPQQVFDEVDQLSEEEAIALGITVFTASLAQLREASVRGGPSRQDKLCYIAARDTGGAVWSNDVQLRKLCMRNKVVTYWGVGNPSGVDGNPGFKFEDSSRIRKENTGTKPDTHHPGSLAEF